MLPSGLLQTNEIISRDALPKCNDISSLTPIPGCMAYHHPLIPIIPSASGNQKRMMQPIFGGINSQLDNPNSSISTVSANLATNVESAGNTQDRIGHGGEHTDDDSSSTVSTKSKTGQVRKMAFGSPTWSAKDDELLRYLKETEKIGWRDISMYFPTRTINACQFRWRRLIMKEENKKKRELHKKSIKERLRLKDIQLNIDSSDLESDVSVVNPKGESDNTDLHSQR